MGLAWADWLCAADAGCYKPRREFWYAASRRRDTPLGPWWWHVSAYADYDLEVARGLGLTTVYVERPHRRPGAADLVVPHLGALADVVDGATGR
jgi:FMN phosphatase YigB (HAD superfamily)